MVWPFSRKQASPPPTQQGQATHTQEVLANRALTKATEGRVQRWGRKAHEFVRGSEGRTAAKDLDANLANAEKRLVTSQASHKEGSEANKALGKAQYEKNFQKRNETHDKELTQPYNSSLHTAQNLRSGAEAAGFVSKNAGRVVLASAVTGVGAGAAATAGTVAVVADAAGATLNAGAAAGYANVGARARSAAETAETENKKGFHESIGKFGDAEAATRGVAAGHSLLSSVTGHISDDLSVREKSAGTMAGMVLGKVEGKLQDRSDEHWQKAANIGRSDQSEIDNAKAAVIQNAYRNKKANTLFTALQDGAQKAGQERLEALDKIGAGFAKARKTNRSNRLFTALQEGAQKAGQERLEALDKIGAGFAKARKTNRSNRLFTALQEGAQKAGEEGLEAKNKADQEHLQQLSARFDADSGGKTVGARFNEYFFNKKSTHTQLGESLRTAAAATNQEDRGAAVSEVAKHSSAWQGRNPKSQGGSRGKAIGTLQEGIARHMPGQPK